MYLLYVTDLKKILCYFNVLTSLLFYCDFNWTIMMGNKKKTPVTHGAWDPLGCFAHESMQ